MSIINTGVTKTVIDTVSGTKTTNSKWESNSLGTNIRHYAQNTATDDISDVNISPDTVQLNTENTGAQKFGKVHMSTSDIKVRFDDENLGIYAETVTTEDKIESVVNNLTDTVELGLNPDIAVGSLFKTTNIADPEYYSQVLQYKDFTELRAKKADNTTYHEINADASVISCFDVDNTITEISNIETLSINKSVDISGITAVTVLGNIEPDFPTNPAILGEQTTITYGANVVTHRLAAEPAGSAISRVQDADFSCVISQNSNQFNLQNSGANQVQILGEVEAGQVIVSASDNDVNSSQVTTAIGSVEVFSTDGTSTTIVVTNAESHEANAVSGDKTVTLSLDPTDNYSGTGFYVNDAVTGNAGIGMYSDSITSTVATPTVDSRVKIEPGLVDIRNTAADGSSTIMQSEVGNIAWTLTDVPNTKSTTFGATPERFDIGSDLVEFVSMDGANNATTSQNSGEVSQSITNGTNSTSSSFMPGEYTLSATDGSTVSGIGITASAGITSSVSGALATSTVVQNASNITATAEEINLDGQLKITSVSAVLNFGLTLPTAETDLTIAYTGAVVGDKVALGAPVPASGGMYIAFVSAPNVVTVRFICYGGTSITPGSNTFNVSIIKSI